MAKPRLRKLSRFAPPQGNEVRKFVVSSADLILCWEGCDPKKKSVEGGRKTLAAPPAP